MPSWVGWTLVPEDYMPSSDTLVSAVPLRPGRTRSSTLAKSAPVGPCHVACTATTNTNDSVSTRPQRQTNSKPVAVQSAPTGAIRSATKSRCRNRPGWKGWVPVPEDFMLPDNKLVTFTPICVSRTRNGGGHSL
jgi:hypothetical protein